jgi:hypothetical protein
VQYRQRKPTLWGKMGRRKVAKPSLYIACNTLPCTFTRLGLLTQVNGRRPNSAFTWIACSCGGRGSGHASPGGECGVAGGAIFSGGKVMTTELEVVVELAMAGKELLRVAGRLEPLHVPLSPPCRLVRDLDFVVEIAALPMLHLW